MNTGAQQVLDWITKNPNTVSKIIAEIVGSEAREDIEIHLETFVEILTAINIVAE